MPTLKYCIAFTTMIEYKQEILNLLKTQLLKIMLSFFL